jgi:hypothetical protein
MSRNPIAYALVLLALAFVLVLLGLALVEGHVDEAQWPWKYHYRLFMFRLGVWFDH